MFWLAAGLCLSAALCVLAALVFDVLASARRLPPPALLALVLLAFAATLEAQKTNVLMQALHCLVQSSPRTVSDEEIARGWRLESISTDASASLEMPAGASPVGSWHVHGARSSLGCNKIDFPGFSFPLGTNSTSSFWYFVDGRIRPTPRDELHEIRAAGGDMFAAPNSSRLWTAAEPDGSRVMTWERFFLGDDTNTPVSAQIRLCPNGDIVTRSNSFERVYRRVNPRDFDGDGIANERDANQYFNDGDFFGQGNPIPAGADTNDYYWLELVPTGALGVAEISVDCDGPSDLGSHLVIARTNEVCRVTLLAGATYSVQSDLPIGRSAVSTEYAHIVTNSETSLTVSLPLEFWFERIETRGTAIYALRSSPVDVAATFSGLGGGCCTQETTAVSFTWNCAPDCQCGGAYGDEEAMYATASWEGYSLPFGWSARCPCWWSLHDALEAGPRIVLSMPDTLYTNDDGSAEPSDVVELLAGIDYPVSTNGTLTLDSDSSGSVNVWTASNRTGAVSLPYSWDSAADPLKTFYVEGAKTKARGSGALSLSWRDAGGTQRLAEELPFAVYSPVLRIVANDLYDGGDLCNPAGVAIGTNACFAVEFQGAAPPPSEVAWSIAEGAAHFAGPGTGYRVRVVADEPGEEIRLRMQIGGCRSRPVEATVYSVEPMSVKVTAWIIGDKDGAHYAATPAAVSNMLAGVNKIYEQIGVSFYLDSISSTNNGAWLDISDPSTGDRDPVKRRSLVDMAKDTNGLEIYFVDRISKMARADYDAYGIVVSTNANVRSLAHEIGHAFGCADVFDTVKEANYAQLPETFASEGHFPLDWNNGEGCRYYESGTEQKAMVRGMLMYGYGLQDAIDMTAGSVYGFR